MHVLGHLHATANRREGIILSYTVYLQMSCDHFWSVLFGQIIIPSFTVRKEVLGMGEELDLCFVHLKL